MTFWTMTVTVLAFCWEMIYGWINIFIDPFKQFDVFWILIPIWLAWFFAEFFQEKRGTSFGNAISNGVVPLFVGFDWIRTLVNAPIKANTSFWIPLSKYALCVFVIGYGLLIIYSGIKGKDFTLYLGRIRQVTYVLLVFTPIIYNVIQFNWKFFVQIIIFFPVFYYVIEWFDRIVPDSHAFKKDQEKAGKSIRSPKDILDTSELNYNKYTNNSDQNYNNVANPQNDFQSQNNPFNPSFK